MQRDASDVRSLMPQLRAGNKPDQIALAIIATNLMLPLASGDYHVDRGVLGADGKSLLAAWNRSTTEMRRRGYWDTKQEVKALEWMLTTIKTGG